MKYYKVKINVDNVLHMKAFVRCDCFVSWAWNCAQHYRKHHADIVKYTVCGVEHLPTTLRSIRVEFQDEFKF